MKWTYPALLACLLIGVHPAVSPAAEPDFKNIVVILADDHALKVTGAYGNSIIRTPNIDRLAAEGVTFDRAYCNAPICSASRQSLLTGKYTHATGVNLLFTPFPDHGNITIAEHLRGMGYRTAIIGKKHWNNWAWGPLYADGLPDHGFDIMIDSAEHRRFLRENPPPPIPAGTPVYNRSRIDRDHTAEWMNWRARPHPIVDSHSKGTFLANEAVRFLRESGDAPFLLWLAFNEPHAPFHFPVEFAGRYDPADMPVPTGSPEDDRWVPEKFRHFSEAEIRGIIAAYYTSTEYMDKNIGIVLDALEAEGLAEDTVVVYLSDNGYLLYEHKRFEKHTMWEESVRQPMVVRAGASFRPGVREDALVEYVDVVPTLLELVGAPPIEAAQGKSFREVLTGAYATHREVVFSTYLQDNLAMVASERWKYVFHTGSRDLTIMYATGEGPAGVTHRLYDLRKDPLETQNVADRPEYAAVLRNLQEAMLERFMETHPDAGDCPPGLTLEGKLVWFCEPRDIGYDQSPVDAPTRVFHP